MGADLGGHAVRTLVVVAEGAEDGAKVLNRVDLGAVGAALGDGSGGKGHGEDGEGAHLVGCVDVEKGEVGGWMVRAADGPIKL